MKEKKKQRYKENQNVDKTDIILTKDKELDRQKTRYSEKLTRNKNRRRKIYIIFSHKKNPPSSKLDMSIPVVWGSFLVACTRLYKPLCRSVRRSVGPSVRRSVTLYFFFEKWLIELRVRDLWRSALLLWTYRIILFFSLVSKVGKVSGMHFFLSFFLLFFYYSLSGCRGR